MQRAPGTVISDIFAISWSGMAWSDDAPCEKKDALAPVWVLVHLYNAQSAGSAYPSNGKGKQ